MVSDDSTRDPSTVIREFDTDSADPNLGVVSVVAALEDVSRDELPPLYWCIDTLVEHLFSEPPSHEANAQVSFTYHGYRITVEQDGTATFEPVS